MRTSIQPWVFTVAVHEGESLSHFLGAFRRANNLSATALGRETGLGVAISRWERFYHNPFPSMSDLTALAPVVGVEPERLRQMLPPPGMGMRHRPVRLCAHCYAEEPWHRLVWQLVATRGCEKHGPRLFSLLSECPSCKARFAVPAHWDYGRCLRCALPLADMASAQKSR